jgi:hypothetical protein
LVSLQQRVGTAEVLIAGEETSIPVVSRADSPPVTMTREQSAVVGEPSSEQVTMWIVDEVVWEAQREEWMKEGSGGDDTDYDAQSGKSR